MKSASRRVIAALEAFVTYRIAIVATRPDVTVFLREIKRLQGKARK